MNWKVPLVELELTDGDVEAALDVLRSEWLTMGPRTQELEAAFAAEVGAEHGVAVSSCSAALHLACLAAGVGPGDEVIVPAMTFVADGPRRAPLRRRGGARRVGAPARPQRRPRGRRGAHHASHEGGHRRPLLRLSGRRRAAARALRGARARADRGLRPGGRRPRRGRPRAGTLGDMRLLLVLLEDPARGGGGRDRRHRRRGPRGAGALAALPRDDLRHLGPPPRPRGDLRRDRRRLQLPHRRDPRRRGAVAPAAPGRERRGPARGRALLPRGAHRHRRPRDPLRRGGRGARGPLRLPGARLRHRDARRRCARSSPTAACRRPSTPR